MNQDQIISMVEKSGVQAQAGTRQQQWHQVRFNGVGTDHSLNLGYSLPKEVLIADFVFKSSTREFNLQLGENFCEQHGGELRTEKTIFARLEIPFKEESRLIHVIQAYWAIPLIRTKVKASLTSHSVGSPKRPSLPTHPLKRWDEYTREEIHAIFSPDTVFTPQAGTWGILGIVPVPDRPGDYVFMATQGKTQAHHTFDEEITADGVLTWQSQPKHTLHDPVIKQLIQHDEALNTIHLFLRSDEKRPYSFLGNLKYLAHDKEKEKPVYFHWQILEWDPPVEELRKRGLHLTPSSVSHSESLGAESLETYLVTGLSEQAPPLSQGGPTKGVPSSTFKKHKQADHAKRDAANRKLGEAGEQLVLKFEKERLAKAGLAHFVDRIRHVAALEGDGAGYDIYSVNLDGSPRYIEVKTTKGPATTDFFLSANEVAFAKAHPLQYFLYRVYELSPATGIGLVYISPGPVGEPKYSLLPMAYRVRLG